MIFIENRHAMVLGSSSNIFGLAVISFDTQNAIKEAMRNKSTLIILIKWPFGLLQISTSKTGGSSYVKQI